MGHRTTWGFAVNPRLQLATTARPAFERKAVRRSASGRPVSYHIQRRPTAYDFLTNTQFVFESGSRNMCTFTFVGFIL